MQSFRFILLWIDTVTRQVDGEQLRADDSAVIKRQPEILLFRHELPQ